LKKSNNPIDSPKLRSTYECLKDIIQPPNNPLQRRGLLFNYLILILLLSPSPKERETGGGLNKKSLLVITRWLLYFNQNVLL